MSQYRFRSGSFSEDASGRWYFNIVVDVETPKGQDRIGIDLGLLIRPPDAQSVWLNE